MLQWPLLFAAGRFAGGVADEKWDIATFVGCSAALLIFAPLMYLLFVTLGFNVIGVSALAILLGILLTLMSALLPRISRPLRVSVLLLLACASVLTLAGVRLTQFSPEHPRRHSLLYAINADEQRAAWISYDDATDHWTREVLGHAPVRAKTPAFTVGSARETLSNAAEFLPTEPPTATLLSDRVAENMRIVTLQLASPATRTRC